MSSNPAAQGCIQHAGILDENEVLTETAKARIIERLKQEGRLGFSAVSPFPCDFGSSIAPAIGLVPEDLEDATKYPDFHNIVLPTYEKIAKGFNFNGPPNLPFPFCDPLALALSLGIDPPEFDFIDFPTLTPPQLAMMLGFKLWQIPDLMLAFNIPPALPKPDFGIPNLDVSINLPPDFQDKFDFDLWALKMPQIFLDFVAKISADLPGIIDLSLGKPCPIINKIANSKPFGPSAEGDLTKALAIADMTVFAGQCMSIAVVGTLAGTAPSGATGKMGESYGYKTAEKVAGNGADQIARNVIIDTFKLLFNRNPTNKEVQFAQALAKAENSTYNLQYKLVKVDDPKHPGKKKQGAQLIQASVGKFNWGNTHGAGTAGSFTSEDNDEAGKLYTTKFAAFRTNIEGCRYFMNEIFVRRSFVLDEINKTNFLWNPVLLLTSQSTLGSNRLHPGKGPASDAVNPNSGVGAYAVKAANEYYANFISSLKLINKTLKEESAFDLRPPPADNNSFLR